MNLDDVYFSHLARYSPYHPTAPLQVQEISHELQLQLQGLQAALQQGGRDWKAVPG